MSNTQFLDWLPTLLSGLEMTVFASLLSIVLSLILGSLVASLDALNNSVISVILRIYTTIFRNVPLLIVMFFCFYGLPLIGITLPNIVCGILAVTLNEGAFVSEIIRGAVQKIPKGEIEAAASMGLTRLQIVCYVIFPISFRVSIPTLLGQASVMIKDTSLFSMIMILDLTRAGNLFYSKYFNPTSIWIVGGIYVVLFLLFSFVGKILENKLRVLR